jgi:hypothetical protein
MPQRSSFCLGERTDQKSLKNALNEVWRAADLFDQRAVLDETLGRWIRRDQFLFGDSPLGYQPYSIALNLDSGEWRDRACTWTGHGLLALAVHTMGLRPAKVASRILFLLRHIGPTPYRTRRSARGPRGRCRRPVKPPRPSWTERPTTDPRALPPLLPAVCGKCSFSSPRSQRISQARSVRHEASRGPAEGTAQPSRRQRSPEEPGKLDAPLGAREALRTGSPAAGSAIRDIGDPCYGH